MNSFALITAIALAADFSLAATSIARARMLKTLRKSLAALAAFAIATSFIASLRRRIHRPSRQALPRDAFAQFG